MFHIPTNIEILVNNINEFAERYTPKLIVVTAVIGAYTISDVERIEKIVLNALLIISTLIISVINLPKAIKVLTDYWKKLKGLFKKKPKQP